MTSQIVVLCAAAFLVQSIAGQACGRISIPQPSCGSSISVSNSIAGQPCGIISLPQPSCGGSISVSNNGGSLIVTSVGPIAPAGIAVATDLALCGDLALSGSLPFLSAVAFDGQFPTAGSAAVSYGCGDGTIAITQELGNPTGNNAVSASGLSVSQLATCGCNKCY